MSAHTPGPWHIEDASYGQIICAGKTDVAVVRNADGLPHHDNARLIAAAPCLLHELQCCVNLIAASGINGAAQTIADARAAIAKAVQP